MALERIESLPSLPPRAADSHKGAVRHGPRHRRRPGDGRRGGPLRRLGTPVGRGTGPGGHPGGGPAHRGQLRAVLHDLSAARRRRRDGPARAVAPGARAPDRAGRRRGGRARAWASPTTSAGWSAGSIESTSKPLVIDADGLNALAGQTELLSGLTRPVILTPHPGEFARLTGTDIAAVQADRIELAVRLAACPSRWSWCSRAPGRS